MIFRVRFKVMGGHVHCMLFSGNQENMTFAKLGDFRVTKGEEMNSLVSAMSGVQFMPDYGSMGLLEACKPPLTSLTPSLTRRLLEPPVGSLPASPSSTDGGNRPDADTARAPFEPPRSGLNAVPGTL